MDEKKKASNQTKIGSMRLTRGLAFDRSIKDAHNEQCGKKKEKSRGSSQLMHTARVKIIIPSFFA